MVAVVAVAAAAGAQQQDAVFSGPQVGEKVTPFKVLGIRGPDMGKELRLLEGAPAPVCLVFIHQIERSIVPLLTTVDEYGWDTREKMRTQIVFLGADRVMMEQRLPLVAQSLRMMCPVSYSLDGAEGPGNYGLNKRCLMTLVLAKDNRVMANFALIQPGIADAPKVLAEMAKLAGAAAPPEVEKLQQQRRARNQ